MSRATAGKTSTVEKTANQPRDPSLSRCQELARHAMDCLGIESAGRLTPHDRAKLASATALLEEICRTLKDSPFR